MPSRHADAAAAGSEVMLLLLGQVWRWWQWHDITVSMVLLLLGIINYFFHLIQNRILVESGGKVVGVDSYPVDSTASAEAQAVAAATF